MLKLAAAYGAHHGDTVNQAARDHRYASYSDYSLDKSAADSTFLIGAVGLGVGVGAGVGGWFAAPDDSRKSVEVRTGALVTRVLFDGTRATEKALAARLKVRATPTLMFLDERGAAVLRLNGYYDPGRFLLALDYVSNREYRKQPDFQAYLKSRGASAEERNSRVAP